MILGVYNAILHDRPLADALKVIADIGLDGIEINSGGFLPPVHIQEIDEIVSDATVAKNYLAQFEGTGVSIAGLNCSGNPLHPNPDIGQKHADDIRRSIKAAAALGQTRVVTMSGLPGGEPGATRPNWIVNAWTSSPSGRGTASSSGRSSSGRCTRWILTWRSTSNTRTSSSGLSKDSRPRPAFSSRLGLPSSRPESRWRVRVSRARHRVYARRLFGSRRAFIR